MQVRRIDKSTFTIAAIVLTAIFAACSTTKNATGPANPGNASKGDSVNLSGTYHLASFTGRTVDASDSATIVLSPTTYRIQPKGDFDCTLGADSGTYVAIDTSSSSVVAGTIVLTSVIDSGVTSGAFVLSHDSLQVNVPNNGSTQYTVWLKQ